METPKPRAPKPQNCTADTTEVSKQESKPSGKKPFVHTPRLTHRPFADNQALARLGTQSKRQR